MSSLFRFLVVTTAAVSIVTSSSSSSRASITDSPPVITPHYQYNFHKDAPLVPGPNTSLEELEATATDDFILRTIDQIVPTDQAHGKYNNDVILTYNPERTWLWRRWHGTILQASVHKVLLNMGWSAILCVGLRRICGATWGWGLEPSGDQCLWVARLKVFDKLWHYQQTLTTFILTFFLGQAYSLWRDMYTTARKIQGRLSDVSMLLATHAQTTTSNSNSQSGSGGGLTDASQQFLQTIARQLRLYHTMVWASQARQFKVLLTNRGLQFMKDRGIMTQMELDTLLHSPLAPSKRHNAILEWIIVEVQEAQKRDILHHPQHSQKLLLTKLLELRGTCAGIPDIIDGRMPLAYAHFVQVLVDTFLFAAPLALYAELGIFSVICVGFMTLFYEGLLDLSKIFLDPLDLEDYLAGGVDMDLGVFIRESNSGSELWANGMKGVPTLAAAATAIRDTTSSPPTKGVPTLAAAATATGDTSAPTKSHQE